MKYSARKRQELKGERTWGGQWVNWRRKALTGVGEFSKEVKSIYNKEKWLPLCQDAQFMISHMCCDVMKKHPLEIYHRESRRYPIIGTLTEESRLREQKWLQNGCNAFEAKKKSSQPMSFWLEQDVLQYIKDKGLEIASVYGDIVTTDADGMEYDTLLAPCGKLKCTGCERTGCIFCGFGAHLEKGETRFQRLAKTHPKQYEYCMRGGNGLTIRPMTRQRRNMTESGRTGTRKRFGCRQRTAWA